MTVKEINEIITETTEMLYKEYINIGYKISLKEFIRGCGLTLCGQYGTKYDCIYNINFIIKNEEISLKYINSILNKLSEISLQYEEAFAYIYYIDNDDNVYTDATFGIHSINSGNFTPNRVFTVKHK